MNRYGTSLFRLGRSLLGSVAIVGMFACGSGPSTTVSTGLAGARSTAHSDQSLTITLYNVNTRETLANLVLQRQRPHGVWIIPSRMARRFRTFLRDWRTGREHAIADRLIALIGEVASHFRKPIDVVSAYRVRARKTSRHRHGKAIDFRVRGVPPRVVWEYAKRFDNIGLGLYPASGFVHLDIRRRSYYWIDDAGPGQAPRYRPGIRQPGLRASGPGHLRLARWSTRP